MSNENVARMISGMDSGDHFNLGEQKEVNTFNEQVDSYLDKFEKHSQELEAYAKNLSNDFDACRCVDQHIGNALFELEIDLSVYLGCVGV